jgi:hypothetical protein
VYGQLYRQICCSGNPGTPYQTAFIDLANVLLFPNFTSGYGCPYASDLVFNLSL